MFDFPSIGHAVVVAVRTIWIRAVFVFVEVADAIAISVPHPLVQGRDFGHIQSPGQDERFIQGALESVIARVFGAEHKPGAGRVFEGARIGDRSDSDRIHVESRVRAVIRSDKVIPLARDAQDVSRLDPRHAILSRILEFEHQRLPVRHV